MRAKSQTTAGQPTLSKQTLARRASRFWQRVTEGRQLSELWSQFRTDARTSYRLYSRDVDSTRVAGTNRRQHFANVAAQFFWAIIEKLTPARRVLLLAAMVLIVLPGGEISWNTHYGEAKSFALDFHFWGGLLMFALLILEVGDRVVMKRDLQIAKEIQAWLLPAQPPQIPGLQIAFTTRPANTAAGDYYDVFPETKADGPPGKFLIVIADVAGKSVPAAMLMATFQASLKTLSSTPGTLPELVSRMNRYACTNSQNGRRFTTAFVAEYEPATRLLTYLNAGHNQPILRRASGVIERLEAGGVPLGVIENAPYDSATTALAAGDWLVIFTDGVIEAENNAQQEYGESRLLTVVNSGVALTPDALLNNIIVDVDRFAGDAPQHDDVTCILVKAV